MMAGVAFGRCTHSFPRAASCCAATALLCPILKIDSDRAASTVSRTLVSGRQDHLVHYLRHIAEL